MAINFIYLTLPEDYYCVYNNLLKDLSCLGIKGLTQNCNNYTLPCNTISGITRDCYNISRVFDSWNMFQIACGAYGLGEKSKANKIIDFINKKMNYCCDISEGNYFGNIVYYGQVDSEPDETVILEGSVHSPGLNSKFDTGIITKLGHYIAVPVDIDIRTIENSSFRGDWLYNTTLDLDLYTRTPIEIDGEDYILWYCEFVIPFNSSVEVTF